MGRNCPANWRPNAEVLICLFCGAGGVMVCGHNWNFWRNLLKVRTRCLHLGHVQRCIFWYPDGDLSCCLFVFAIFWLDPFTAMLQIKRAASLAPTLVHQVLYSTTGGQHVLTFGTHCRTWVTSLTTHKLKYLMDLRPLLQNTQIS